MTTHNFSHQHGFSAVELLITLFIAAIFLLAGYQLYSFVLASSTAGFRDAKASSYGYQMLRQYSSKANDNPCNSTGLPSDDPVNIDGLKNAKLTITISCPTALNDTISLVESEISYTDPNGDIRKVHHAIYYSAQ